MKLGHAATQAQLFCDIDYRLDATRNASNPLNNDTDTGLFSSYRATLLVGSILTRKTSILARTFNKAYRTTVSFNASGTGTLTHYFGGAPNVGQFGLAPAQLESVSPGMGVRIVSFGATTCTLRIVNPDGTYYAPGAAFDAEVMGWLGVSGWAV